MYTNFQKALGIPILFIYLNLIFIFFQINVFFNPLYLTTVISFNFFICVDIFIRPISSQKDQYKKSVLIISFLLMPIITVAPYFEYTWWLSKYMPLTTSNFMWIVGIVLLIIGGLIELLSRIQIGKFGGPKIVVEQEHQLITSGIYNYIRHPMYLGFLFLFLGYSMSFGSIILTCVITISFFLIFKNRMDLEEKLLIASFEDEYLKYMNHTRRLFPFIY